MEQLPADARAAPSASAPNDTVMDIASSPKRPRDPAQDNRVSQRATPFDPAMLEIQGCTTKCLLREPARACQSLAHHTTPMGRCRKTVDTSAPPAEEPQSRSTTTNAAERRRKQGNSATQAAVHHCSHLQTTSVRESTRASDTNCSKEQTLPPTTSSFSTEAERTPPRSARDALNKCQRQTAHLSPSPTNATHQKTCKLTPLHSHPSQKGKGKAPPPPPTIVEETMEDGDDPNFVSDTNNLITIKQKGPTFREIRDTDMGAAITYLLLDLEGVDTDPDILDDGKKGPWTIFATAECAEQFKGKYGEAITMTFSETPIEFTITYGEIETKKGGPSNDQSNARRALASALADSTTHLVVRINEKSIANRVNLSHLNAACKRAGLKMVKGNREKRKINTPDGLITTSGKKFVWHLYVMPHRGTQAVC
eukprot:scaffold9490_cov128-Isochrysis_galbana.AAC.1